MDQESTSTTAEVIELGEKVKLILRWSNDTWYMDLRVQDFYLIRDREMLGLEWGQIGGARRVALMTSKNYLTNLAARMISAAASAAKTLKKSAQDRTELKVKGEEDDL